MWFHLRKWSRCFASRYSSLYPVLTVNQEHTCYESPCDEVQGGLELSSIQYMSCDRNHINICQCYCEQCLCWHMQCVLFCSCCKFYHTCLFLSSNMCVESLYCVRYCQALGHYLVCYYRGPTLWRLPIKQGYVHWLPSMLTDILCVQALPLHDTLCP